MKILHIAEPQTFTQPFFKLIESKLNPAQHFILSHSSSNEWPKDLSITNNNKVGLSWILQFTRAAYRADKIIIHGLWDFYVTVLLSLQPWLLKKCYWMIWGGDLYDYTSSYRNWKWWLRLLFKRPVIKKMGNLITYVEGDVELARNWYGATGKYHECIMYTSNIYREHNIVAGPHKTINIQIGNSADPSNNHIEILEALSSFRNENIEIYAPLSYGNKEHAQSVIRMGREIFGEKFKPLTKLMPFDQYLEFLGKVDIAIFNHKRQQAMGNTITLLGMGKKVYMRSDITPWPMFKKMGVKVYELSSLDLNPMDEATFNLNRLAIRNNFSEKNLVDQLNKIFEG
ncbi:TDP-N-acetylfucosamine:lipid II N-acetylfucosaminyltransferase [Pseudomonas sp. LA21]|uniref:TDP-N-acetylfucosamine:lipid II N-acetylfucosaminyltransferase n=1 Tax=unclassified Pseudomonas TaxID=196821 RepID=UPI001FB7A31D|nr:TDP-N-acetylfucosamine:lipid II N-acetylfucosaminyltransferase [Pseudomonas sp. LA21]MCJ1883440.1 TDP-N-acetylfucosamine:lipid II N-acetylfucosaminyltransferase [Pseudomonas sp. LA21]